MARMSGPVTAVPGALPALLHLSEIINKVGLPKQTLDLVHLRTSQINGCAGCIHMHADDLGTGLEVIEDPRSAWMLSCPRVMPCPAQVAAISFSARAADSRVATIQPTAYRL